MEAQIVNEQIISFCQTYGIEKYSINTDGSVDVDGDLILEGYYVTKDYQKMYRKVANPIYKSLFKLPIKFNRVSGHLCINGFMLTHMDNFPKYVDGTINLYNVNLPETILSFLNYSNVFDDNQESFKTILKYQDHYDIWTPDFNNDNFLDLKAEIIEGLR